MRLLWDGLKCVIFLGLVSACSTGPCRELPPSMNKRSQASSEASPDRIKETQFNQMIEVAIADGSLQCEPESGKPLSEFKKILVDSGIQVFAESRKMDGLMRFTKCESPTGYFAVFRISAADLNKALKLDFVRWEW